MNLDRRLLRQVNAARLAFVGAVLFGVAGGWLTLLQARRLSQIVAEVFLNGQTLAGVSASLRWLLLIILLRAGVAFAGELAAGAAALKVKANLREMLLRRLFELGPAYTQEEHSGELVTTVVEGIEALDAYFSQYLPQLVLAALIPLLILLAVFPIDGLSGLVLLFTAPLIPVFMILIGQNAKTLTLRQWNTLQRMSVHFLDTLQGLTTLKMLNRSRERVDSIRQVSERYRQATLRVLRLTFLSALVLEMVGTISVAIVAVQIGIRLLYGHIGFEEAFFILVIAPDFYLPLRTLGLRFHAGTSGVAAAQRIFEVLEAPRPSAAPAPGPVRREIRLAPPFELAFEGVGFTYPNRSEAALDGVTFEIHSGQRVALVGPSGSGKSTLLHLLLRFGEPQSGRILLNRAPLSEIALEDWRTQVAWVPQQPYLFNDTLSANIRLGNPQASPEAVRQAALQANLDDFIQSLPNGYETEIGERGARLSSGQAQRLALARAFLKDAPLMVMDEPTAHLDPEQEDVLREAVYRLGQGRTVVMIAHRLATLQQADAILVLQAGRVVEVGTHAELLSRRGAY
ncbi:MAG: thiol reductant ABC exporter subunit CydD, partial [Chloroflexi bacterium]|nr:thiol reductant ABC exporter subunit CydD [Chloroflexota bacterium]